MSQMTPNDEYDDPVPEQPQPKHMAPEPEEHTHEQSYTFDGDRLTPDAPRPVSAPVPAPAPQAPSQPERQQKKRLSRKERRQLRSQPTRYVQGSPTIGRNLRNGQMLVYDSELDEVDYTDSDDLPELRDYLPIRFRRYGRSGIGGGILYALFVISASVILACFAWMCAVDVLALNKDYVAAPITIEPYNPTGDMPKTVTMEDSNGDPVEVEIKVDIDQVADALKSGGIIEYKWLFKLFSQFSHASTKMDPGTYDVNTTLDYRALVTVMQFGSAKQETTQVTFPEGFSMDQIFTLLESSNVCQKEDLYEAAANYDFDYAFLEGIPLGDASRLEGFLFPDTYEFYQGEAATTSISRFLNNTEKKLTEEILADVESSGLTLHEVITMASLIEKEAGGNEGERENMASVIFNRLGAGMPLGLDCTINYIKGTSTLDLTLDDLNIDSPYNTYLYEGLPPGPICNPGMASIEAVLDPASTNYYYWYSTEGVSYFFPSYEEQQAFIYSNSP